MGGAWLVGCQAAVREELGWLGVRLPCGRSLAGWVSGCRAGGA